MRTKYPEKFVQLNNRMIGFITHTRSGKYRVKIGKVYESPEDFDSFVNVVECIDEVETVEQAVELFKPIPYLTRVFTSPIESGSPIWVSTLIGAEKLSID